MKTAFVGVASDFHGAKASGQFSFLIPVEPSAASDRADDAILPGHHTDFRLSLCQLLLCLLRSFQGSVLGPLL